MNAVDNESEKVFSELQKNLLFPFKGGGGDETNNGFLDASSELQ
jgi:hypothetical protein